MGFRNCFSTGRFNASFAGYRPSLGYLDAAFAYTGRFFDSVTGLQNNLNRWYDASVGRWLSEDPIGFAGDDANLYRYVDNGPVNATDPSGLANSIGGKGARDAGKFCITTVFGKEVCGLTPEDLLDALDDTAKRGDKIKSCVLKGHGDDSGIFDKNDQPLLEIMPGGGIRTGNRNATDSWRKVLDSDSNVSLRGCSTSIPASHASQRLPGTFGGSQTPVIGIPGTIKVIGPGWWSYFKNGVWLNPTDDADFEVFY